MNTGRWWRNEETIPESDGPNWIELFIAAVLSYVPAGWELFVNAGKEDKQSPKEDRSMDSDDGWSGSKDRQRSEFIHASQARASFFLSLHYFDSLVQSLLQSMQIYAKIIFLLDVQSVETRSSSNVDKDWDKESVTKDHHLRIIRNKPNDTE